MNLWLVGMMGAGKTSVGRLVADHLGLGFLDTDEMAESRLGESISQFWDARGEGPFRQLEREIVLEAALIGGVISTGGGAVTSPKNRATMISTGRVVWLQASPSAIIGRVTSDIPRPLLRGSTVHDVAELADLRRPGYAAVADLTLDTNGRSAEDVAQEVVAWWSA